MFRILLVDDDAHLGEPLATYFARFGLELVCALSPSEGLRLLQQNPFDAAILDIMLPEMDGFKLCRLVRERSDIPIIMLTARGDLTDKVVGLELGADDYLPKPFEPRELVARLQTIIRRRQPGAPGLHEKTLRFEGLQIDGVSRSVHVKGQALELTTGEFDTLWLLAKQPGRVFTRDDMLSALHGHDVNIYTRAVDITVSRLRKKLEPLEAIKTLRNTGYALVLKPLP